MIEYDVKMIFKLPFRDLLDNEVNEFWVKQIISKSKFIYKGKKFKRNLSQYNGEPDYIDINSGYELDLKMFLPESFSERLNMGQEIGMDVIKSLMDVINANIEKIVGYVEEDYSDKTLELYLNRFNKKISRKLEKNNVIVFFPFPLMKSKGSFALLSNDTIENWLLSLYDNYEGENELYFLAPTFENEFYLKEISNSNNQEFISHVHYFTRYFAVLDLKHIK